MDHNLAARMFHALVVMGAALGGGCGPAPTPDKEGTSSGDPDATSSSTTTPIDPTTTTAPAITSGATSSSTGEVETTTLVTGSSTSSLETTGAGPIDGPEDCAFAQQFKCEVLEPPTNCFCDLDAPLVPGDCAHSEQFFCDIPWQSPPQGCFCDLDAPTVPEDCAFPNNFNCLDDAGVATQCRCDCDSRVPNPQGQKDCDGVGNYFCLNEPVGCCCFAQIG